MEGGIRTVDSLMTLVFLYDDALQQRKLFLEETTFGRRALGIVGRAARLLFIDGPITELQTSVIHEVFGHGARARELHLSVGYQLSLPFPYDSIAGVGANSSGVTTGLQTRYSPNGVELVAAGIESNFFAAYWNEVDVLRAGGRMHYRQMLAYLSGKLHNIQSFNTPQSYDPTVGDDVTNYLFLTEERFDQWTSAERASVQTHLQYAYLTNFIDPMFWLSTYHLLVTYLFRGERTAQLPLLDVNGVKLFPGTRFNLSPFGAEHYLDVFALHPRGTLILTARVGSSGLASYWGAGAKLFDVSLPLGVTVGGELEVWRQPEILLTQRYVFDRPDLFGISAAIHAEWRLLGRVGIVTKVAWKTRGYLMGEPLDSGLYGYLGLSLSLDDPAE